MIIMTIETKEITIDSELLNKVSEIANLEGKTENKVLNELIEKAIEDKDKIKIPDHLIANKNRKPDPEKTRELIGIIKTKEPFDTAKAIDEVRRMEY